METLTIRLGSRSYDGVMPIVHREVGIPGVDIQVKLDNNVPRLFASLFKGEFDAGEMSLAELIYYTSRGKADFIGVPVFPSRVFRHGCLFCLRDSGIQGPGDLAGRKIGFQRWVQTAGVWMRGMLVEDHGLQPARDWYVASMHHWEDAPEDEVGPRDGSSIRRYGIPADPQTEVTARALLSGEVDVIGVTENVAPSLLANERVRRLFEDAAAEEAAYYQRTGIFPIMHVLAIKTNLVENRPELPEELFRLFCEAKQRAHATVHAVPSWGLAWKDEYAGRERQLFGRDPWQFGLSANRHVVDKFVDYCWQQGIAARRLDAQELFAPSTWELVDAAG
jgi:4,5-dihydroxyphthalate decarboxylase